MEAVNEKTPRACAMVVAGKQVFDVLTGLAGTAVFLVAWPVLAMLVKVKSPGQHPGRTG
jgi:hypothetical protein